MKRVFLILLAVLFISCEKDDEVIIEEESYEACEPEVVSPDNAKADAETGLIEFDIIPDINSKGITKGAAIKDKLWDEGVIPYYFKDDDIWYVDGEKHIRFGYEGEKRDTVRKALEELSAETGLQFIEYDNRQALRAEHSNGVFIEQGIVNSSHVGMQSGIQRIYLGGDPEISTIKHEFLHAAGLLHEATRTDRDEHIVIHYDNIPESYHRQFDKHEEQEVFEGYDCGNFDFESIMLYPSFRSYAIDTTQPTISSTEGEIWERNNEVSQGDINTVQALYKDEFAKRE